MSIKAINDLIKQETSRQDRGLTMIASENYCSKEVMSAVGSPLTNKYSEGYPGNRYYTGNEYIDKLEILAQKSCLEMFGLSEKTWHANVQPHSGSSANLAVYLGLLNLGDKILAMDLAHGGHLTHGSPVNFSGKLFKFVHYGVDKKTQKLDYSEIEKIAIKEKPKMIVCGATAYPRQIDFKQFAVIAKKVGALLLADISHIAGLVVAGEHHSPFPHADIVTSTTHKTLAGPRSAFIVCRNNLALNIDKAIFPGLQGGPIENIIAGKAVCFTLAQSQKFKKLNHQIIKNAQALAEILEKNDLELVTGGTDTHLLLIDVRNLHISGKLAAEILEEADIFTNGNMIPYDPSTPLKPSGLRLGTAALTTRGMKEKEMKLIGLWLAEILKKPTDKKLRSRVKMEVHSLTKKFPL